MCLLNKILFLIYPRECKQSSSPQAHSWHYRSRGSKSHPGWETSSSPWAEGERGGATQATGGAGQVCVFSKESVDDGWNYASNRESFLFCRLAKEEMARRKAEERAKREEEAQRQAEERKRKEEEERKTEEERLQKEREETERLQKQVRKYWSIQSIRLCS